MKTLKLHLLLCRHPHLTNRATPQLSKPKPKPKPALVVCSKSRRTPKPKLVAVEKLPLVEVVSLGVAVVFLMSCDDKALALGPGGPLMEDFWDNMRRYALYALTVSTGAIYAVTQPIVELFKNPISAILVLLIFGGAFYIVSQVVTAMVGLSDFSYDYGY